MSFSTYTELQAAVLSFNWNRDTGSVADFIRLAHTRINLGLRVAFMQKTADLTINSYRISAPSDMAAPVRLWLDDSYDTPLARTSAERIAYLRATYSSGQRPQWYGIEGESDDLEYFVFAADPGATTYTGKLLYIRRLAFFASGSATNVVLDRFPNLYLYGALDEAGAYSDDERTYGMRFEALLAKINQQSLSDNYAGGPLTPTSAYAV